MGPAAGPTRTELAELGPRARDGRQGTRLGTVYEAGHARRSLAVTALYPQAAQPVYGPGVSGGRVLQDRLMGVVEADVQGQRPGQGAGDGTEWFEIPEGALPEVQLDARACISAPGSPAASPQSCASQQHSSGLFATPLQGPQQNMRVRLWDFELSLPRTLRQMTEGDHFFPFGGGGKVPHPWILNLCIEEYCVGVYLHATSRRKATCTFKIGPYEKSLVDTGRVVSADPAEGWGVILPMDGIRDEARVLCSPQQVEEQKGIMPESTVAKPSWTYLMGEKATLSPHSRRAKGWFQNLKELAAKEAEEEEAKAKELGALPLESPGAHKRVSKLGKDGEKTGSIVLGAVRMHLHQKYERASQDARSDGSAGALPPDVAQTYPPGRRAKKAKDRLSNFGSRPASEVGSDGSRRSGAPAAAADDRPSRDRRSETGGG